MGANADKCPVSAEAGGVLAHGLYFPQCQGPAPHLPDRPRPTLNERRRTSHLRVWLLSCVHRGCFAFMTRVCTYKNACSILVPSKIFHLLELHVI